jgi:hypothetical protein
MNASALALFLFSGVVCLAVFLAFIALIIRRFLPPRGKKDDEGPESNVEANLFWKQIRYGTEGPLAEFVILFGTLAFVTMIFWVLLGWNGGR